MRSLVPTTFPIATLTPPVKPEVSEKKEPVEFPFVAYVLICDGEPVSGPVTILEGNACAQVTPSAVAIMATKISRKGESVLVFIVWRRMLAIAPDVSLQKRPVP